jgi:hypothetical protein
MKYEIIEAKDLCQGDVIIELGRIGLVTYLDHGKGAGCTDFGEYIHIETDAWRSDKTNDIRKYWTFQHQPTILVKDLNEYK